MNGEQTRRRGRERPSLFPFPRDARKKQERRGSQIFVQTLPGDDDATKRSGRNANCIGICRSRSRSPLPRPEQPLLYHEGKGEGGEPHWMMVHGAEISQASTTIGVNFQFGERKPRRREEVEPECQYLDCMLDDFEPGNNKRRTFDRPHQVHQICCIGKKRHTETAWPHPGIS